MIKNKLSTAAFIGILSSQAFAAANVPNEATGVTYEYRNGMTARLKCTSSDAAKKNSCFLEIRDRARKIVLDIDHEALGYTWRDLTMNFVTFGNPFKPIFYVQLGVSCEDKDIALVKSNRDLDCSIFFKFENVEFSPTTFYNSQNKSSPLGAGG